MHLHTPAGKPKAVNEAGQAMNGDSGPDSWQAFANMGNIARIMQEKGVCSPQAHHVAMHAQHPFMPAQTCPFEFMLKSINTSFLLAASCSASCASHLAMRCSILTLNPSPLSPLCSVVLIYADTGRSVVLTRACFLLTVLCPQRTATRLANV
jgi:hypothetical protein